MLPRLSGLKRFLLSLSLCLLVLSPSVTFAQGYGYQLIDLGTLEGQTSNGYGLNAGNLVVGSSLLANNTDFHAFSFPAPGGPMADLGTLGGNNSAAFGINTAGVVVGEARDAFDTLNATRWDGGVPTGLGTLDGDVASGATAINSNGDIVGWSQDGSGVLRGFIASGGPLTDLGTLGGDTRANGINDAGIAVGYSVDNTSTQRAFRWDSVNGITDLLGAQANGTSIAFGIAGDFVYGLYTNNLFEEHAFRYDLVLSILTDLGTSGGSSARALAGNAAGFGVGTSGNLVGDPSAFLYDPTFGHLNLNDLLLANPDGIVLTEATAINDFGNIVAHGTLPGGDVHAFYLARVEITSTGAPEASSVRLFGIGLLALTMLPVLRKAQRYEK